MSFFVTSEGGLTAAGYTAFGIAAFIFIVLISVFASRKRVFDTRCLAFSAVAIALAMVASMIKIIDMPTGGSVTLLSMLFIVLIGYWYGPAAGITAGVAYGLLQLLIDPYIISFPQLLLDYPISFGALGISGFFSNRKHGLPIGYVAGILGRTFFAVISGIVFFGSYAPEGTSAFVYSLSYNGLYIFTEAIITLIVIMIPPVAKALATVKKMANG